MNPFSAESTLEVNNDILEADKNASDGRNWTGNKFNQVRTAGGPRRMQIDNRPPDRFKSHKSLDKCPRKTSTLPGPGIACPPFAICHNIVIPTGGGLRRRHSDKDT